MISKSIIFPYFCPTAQFVKEQHFGGGFLTKREDAEGDPDKHKTKKEWIDEIIAESKRKKAEFKKEKEEQHEAVSNLDSKLQNFMKMMAGYAMTDEDKQAVSLNNCLLTVLLFYFLQDICK